MLQALISSLLIASIAIIIGCSIGCLKAANNFKEAVEITKDLKWRILAVYVICTLLLFMVLI